jgi:hypothetical protein
MAIAVATAVMVRGGHCAPAKVHRLPLLEAWTSSVVDTVRIPTSGQRQVSALVGRPRVWDGRLTVTIWPGGERCQIYRVDDDRVFNLGWIAGVDLQDVNVTTQRSTLRLVGEGASVAYISDSAPRFDAAFHLPGNGGRGKRVDPRTLAALEPWLACSLGPSRDVEGTEAAHSGPVTVFDSAGNVVTSVPLPSGLAALAGLDRRVRVASGQLVISLPVCETGMGCEEPYDMGRLLIQIPREKTGSSTSPRLRTISWRDTESVLLPSFHPRSGITEALPVDGTIDGRMVIRRETWYRADSEELTSIELWDCGRSAGAALLDLIAWYNGPGGSFEYRPDARGGIAERAIPPKTDYDFTYPPLCADTFGNGTIVYLRENEGIWELKVP